MSSSVRVPVRKVAGTEKADLSDLVTTEEPLEIRLVWETPVGRTTKSISVTMRTPGNDEELATGFLFSEGIISRKDDISGIILGNDGSGNVIYVTLAANVTPDIKGLERNFYTTSSCGVCGKASIEAVMNGCAVLDTKDNIRIPPETLYTLPARLRQKQEVFEHTGGIHACALFSTDGELLLVREDVGRHNAMDKLLGAALAAGSIPLNYHILLLSGRASFELIQKAAMGGIKVVAAVGAPSSLAVQLADEWGMTLAGFLRGERMNIYTNPERII